MLQEKPKGDHLDFLPWGWQLWDCSKSLSTVFLCSCCCTPQLPNFPGLLDPTYVASLLICPLLAFCFSCRKCALHLSYSPLPWKPSPSRVWPVTSYLCILHPSLLSLKSCISSWVSLRDAEKDLWRLGLRTCKERQRSGPGGNRGLQSVDQG